MHPSLLKEAQTPCDFLRDLIAGLLRVFEPGVSLGIACRPPLSSKCTAALVLVFGDPAVRVHEYIITNRTINAIKSRNR
jgi:hypothetical protein